jgi:glycosyltransferase involved in cell wall biosynthesis
MARRVSPEAVRREDVVNKLRLVSQQYIVYPANFWKHKNHEMLLTAFGLACRSGLPTNLKLVCTGAPGERQRWLISAARAMNLGDRVHFPGYLSDSEFFALMGCSRGVIFPSLYEGFGLPVVEAMAAGVPVACSNRTSLPEVAANSALLFDPRRPADIAQSIVSIAENHGVRTRLVEAGRKHAAEFLDSGRMAKEHWDVFHHASAKRRRRGPLIGLFRRSALVLGR